MLRKKLKEFDTVNTKKKKLYCCIVNKKVNIEQAPVDKFRALWILLFGII